MFILSFIVCTIAWDLSLKTQAIFRHGRTAELWNRSLRFMGRFSVHLASFFAGLTVTSETAVPRRALPDRFILVANHQSLGDIAILIRAFPVHDLKFAAKKELKYGIPAVSVSLRRGWHAFVNRKGGFAETMRSFSRLVRHLDGRVCPVVFPEGTRSRSGRLGQFHTAGVRFLLEHTDLPVVAVAVDGGYKVQKFMDFFTKIRGLVYRTKILKIYPHVRGKAETKELLDAIAYDIERQLAVWRSVPQT
jgi:1-acyl-sn-glycerol-3-phosphate acyltransferase